MIKQLIAAGLRVDGCRDRHGSTALGVAAQLGKTDAMKLLIEGGANLEAVNPDGTFAVVFADGDQDPRVRAEHMRLDTKTATGLVAGVKVKARIGGRGQRFHPATIKAS